MKTQRTKARKRGWPVFIAFALAPLVAAGVVAVCMLLVALRVVPASAPWEQRLFEFWLVPAVIASGAQWTLGLGWHFLAIRKNWRRAIGYVLAGAVLGAGGGIAVLFAATSPTPPGSLLTLLIGYAIMGIVLMTVSMWLFWVMRRPDRDIAPEVAGVFD